MNFTDDEILEEVQTQSHPSHQEIIAAQKITLQDIKDHITGPVVSVIFHVVLLAFLSTMIIFEPPAERTEIEVEVQEVEVKELEKIPEPPKPEEVVEQKIEIERPDVTMDSVEVEVTDVAIDAPATEVVMPSLLSVKPTNSSLIMPALYGMRTGTGRQAAMKKYGGTPASDRAINKALRWLRDHQNPDGSWGDGTPGHFSALTGLALLAFLGHGETPASTEFGACVLKAIRKCIEYVEQGGGQLREGNGYSHGIVTYALAEAYAMTKIPMLEDTVTKATRVIVNGSNQYGGYDYNFQKRQMEGRERTDLSVSGWQYQALKAAFIAGTTVEGIEAAIEKGIKCMKTEVCIDGKGFSYDHRKGGASRTMTSAGTLCLQLFGDGKSKQALDGMNSLQSTYFKFDWDSPQSWFLYGAYYQTQAIFQGNEGRGDKWKEWNKMFATTLVRTQFEDGHWETPSQQEGGHFKGIDGPVYSTCLCCLMLEVYFRFLPTFNIMEAKDPILTSGDPKPDDLGLKIE